jgi:ribonuclease HI
MELKACIEALRLATGNHCPVAPDGYDKIVIFTDSMYVLEGVPRAEHIWPKNNWLTRENEPVMSPDLWKELLRLKRRAGRVEFKKVKAHKTNPHNKRVDVLAKESADLAGGGRPTPRMVARKLSPRKTEARVVPMRGQTETIRIVVVRPVQGQPHAAYKYEVVGEGSPDHGAVDDAFCRHAVGQLRRAHIYEVRFADAGSGRWIEEVVQEIDRGEAGPDDEDVEVVDGS